jgi:hypothetical protein
MAYVLVLLSTQHLDDSQAPERFLSSSRRFWNDRLSNLAIVAQRSALIDHRPRFERNQILSV